MVAAAAAAGWWYLCFCWIGRVEWVGSGSLVFGRHRRLRCRLLMMGLDSWAMVVLGRFARLVDDWICEY